MSGLKIFDERRCVAVDGQRPFGAASRRQHPEEPPPRSAAPPAARPRPPVPASARSAAAEREPGLQPALRQAPLPRPPGSRRARRRGRRPWPRARRAVRRRCRGRSRTPVSNDRFRPGPGRLSPPGLLQPRRPAPQPAPAERIGRRPERHPAPRRTPEAPGTRKWLRAKTRRPVERIEKSPPRAPLEHAKSGPLPGRETVTHCEKAKRNQPREGGERPLVPSSTVEATGAGT